MRPLIQTFGHLFTPAARRFDWALSHPQRAQERVRRDIGDRLMRSDYGRSLGMRSPDDWDQVPIVEYDDIRDWIEHPPCRGGPVTLTGRLAGGRSLTPEPILFYEKTSGSRGAAKHIPYTRSLRKSFNHLFCVWAYDLIRNGPRFSTGKVYFCISPTFASSSEAAETGVEDDSAYLDDWLQWVMKPFWVQPPGVTHRQTVEEFKEALCLTLLREARLETLSIWSPSFLTVHLDYIQTHQLRLRDRLRGQISPQRDALLGASPIPWADLWPELKLISCWDSASAADPAQGLRSRFPGVWVQGKGLLATEAPMTVPLIAAGGCVPLLDEVLFELEDEAGRLHGLTDLSVGQTYTVILSQKGGLYRYRMGDRVRVTQTYRDTPCLDFVGRSHAISDRVGEKLHEAFVADVLAALQLDDCGFKTLIPVQEATPFYLLLLDRAGEEDGAIAQQLDRALCQSYHYHRARQLNQLAPAQVWVSSHYPDLLTQYQMRLGKRWGNLKHPILAIQPLPDAVLQDLKRACDRPQSTRGDADR